jgi:phage terminase Nu1 subunit (DNA packaging protein)
LNERGFKLAPFGKFLDALNAAGRRRETSEDFGTASPLTAKSLSHRGPTPATASGLESPSAKARTRLLAQQGDRAAFAFERERGEWARSGEFLAKLSAELRFARDSLLRIPAQIAARMPRLTREDADTIDTRIRASLTGLGRGGMVRMVEDGRVESI